MAIFFLLEFIWIPDRFYSVADKMIKRKLEFRIWKWVWITLHVESSRDENIHGFSRPINQASFTRECIQKDMYENFIKP